MGTLTMWTGALILAASNPAGVFAPEGPAEATRLEYRIEPLVDFYQYVREQATRTAPSDAAAEFAAAVAAAEALEQKLGANPLQWQVLDRHLATCKNAAELRKSFEGLPAEVRVGGGGSVDIRDEALALAEALVQTEPAYQAQIWPRHEPVIRAALDRIEQQFRPHEAACLQYMLQSLGMEDPQAAIPVFLCDRMTWPEAYTISTDERSGVVFVGVGREQHAGSLLYEVVLHEATHALDLRTHTDASVFKQLRDLLQAAGMKPADRNFRNIPHTLMFIQAAETIRRHVDAKHQHYGDVDGYYKRLGRIADVERRVWIAHLDGDLPRDQALDTIVRELK